jgi:hypothetical protein
LIQQVLIEKFGDIPILLKPHAYTEMDVVNNAILGHKNMQITYLHPSVLSTVARVFISNNFSNTMADAHSFGVTTIEYSNNSANNVLDQSSISLNESVEPKYVSHFIDNNEEMFSNTLENILTDTYSPSIFNGNIGTDDELLSSLASK